VSKVTAIIRILLIEDNRLLREGIVATLKEVAGFIVVGASDGTEDALKKAIAVNPHVVLMDFGLSSQHSIDIVHSLQKYVHQVKIIGMGLSPAQADIMEFVQAGAEGFILKDASVDEVVATIRSVASGQRVLPSLMSGSLFSQVADLALKNGKRSISSSIRMTEREKEVMSLIAEGMSNKQIGETLNIATFTVKSHVHNILEKLQLQSRLQIAAHTRK
jgi:DNA-binding NarL/FixJ family response regulator